MEKEIEEIIKKNLPAQVGDVLKVRLEQAEKDSVKVKQQDETLQNKSATIQGLEKIVADYKQFDTRNTGLDTREKQLNEKEIKLQISELTYQIAAEKDKTDFSKSVALGLVRNTEYRRTLSDVHSDNSHRDQYGNQIHNTKSQNSSEAKSAE